MALRDLAAPGTFKRHVLTLATGTAIAQAIPILASPLLSRIYSPENYGLLAVYLSVLSILTVVATGRYELAIMLPKEDRDGANVVALSLLIAVSLSIATLGVLIAFKTSLVSLLGLKTLGPAVYLIPVVVLLAGVFQALYSWLSRRHQFKSISIARMAQAVTTSSVNVTLGFSGFEATGLVLGDFAGKAVFAATMFWQSSRELMDHLRQVNRRRLLELAKEYSDLPKVSTFHVLVDMLQISGVVFLVSHYYGASKLGFYSFGMRVLRAPLGLVGASIAQVFYSRVAKQYAEGESVHRLVRTMVVTLLKFALPIFGALVLIGPELFSYVFGARWREAGMFVRILTPWLLLQFLVSPISHVPIVMDRQKPFFLFNLTGSIAVLGSAAACGLFHLSARTCMAAISLSMSVYLFSLLCWILVISRNRKGSPSNSSFRVVESENPVIGG